MVTRRTYPRTAASQPLVDRAVDILARPMTREHLANTLGQPTRRISTLLAKVRRRVVLDETKNEDGETVYRIRRPGVPR